MEMGRGAVGAPTTPLSPAVGGGGGGGVTLGVMGMKDLNKEVTRAMQDEFQNEKVKENDEEAKITFNTLESDDQRENLLRLMKLQEIQKKKKEKEEKERRRKKKEERERRKMEKMAKKIEEKDKNLFSSIQGILQPHLETGTPTNQKENKMASEAQQEAKESQTPILTRERKLDCMLNDLANSDLEDLSDELDVPCRYVRIKSEENGQFVWKMRKVPVYAAVDARQTRTRLDLMSALKSGLRQSRAELRRGRGMKWRGWWPYKEEAEATHRKGRKGAGKGSPLLFQKEKGMRTFSQSSVPGRRDALSKLFSSLSFSKLASFFTSQNSMAMDLMKKYTALSLVAPFDSDADFAANANISLHPLSRCTLRLSILSCL
ncbi:uncharacterized protein MONOS_9174 [Monocercomonoides exilis]|uniref:uncharacterized protein n=1 Tax=Monocercomonoides exilis TaxID=2049356 RepID=UPI00355958EB|nr:hypothetical protein MONOS_9174 [Monocercomonoides exilis]|eukprot:MONOS_9174.1-p1 / transcript=MONOS_9174.1 / gene=MONOS_9174 / organism=Monocercomonoides_exilis_PA203 / gene_product=unspecified product / transcript_product=unspecified product / location=Mono_scaffold00370:8267-9391(-) / protein_length=375 / sequence_SO=supercontig / SO=protein_coding / is_pseudo=false